MLYFPNNYGIQKMEFLDINLCGCCTASHIPLQYENDKSDWAQSTLNIVRMCDCCLKNYSSVALFVSPKSGDTMDHAWSSSAPASVSAEIFLCSTCKPHFFWDFFKTLQVACYDIDLATLFFW